MDKYTFSNDKYSVQIDGKTGLVSFLSDRENGKNIVDAFGQFGCAAYTPTGALPQYCDRATRPEPALVLQDKKVLCEKTESVGNGVNCINEEYGVNINYRFGDDALYITMKAKNDKFDQVGLSLDVDYIDKDQSGDYNEQLIPHYFYSGKSKFVIFRRVSGDSVLILGTTPLEAWRIVYDFHTLNGFQFISRFDSNMKSHEKNCDETITARISFHSSPEEAVKEAEKVLNLCIPRLTVSGGAVGSKIPFTVSDKCAEIMLVSPSGKQTEISIDNPVAELCEEGFYKLLCKTAESDEPSDAMLYCYPDIKSLFIRATDAIDKPYHCDFNLCEGAMWLLSLLIRSRLFGLDDSFEWRITEHFNENLYLTKETMEGNEGRIAPFACDGFTPYHLYGMSRIQNAVNLALIQAEAYKVYNNRWYLDLAARYMTNLVRDHLSESGALITDSCGDIGIDYTTVTCCVIGFVEVALLLKTERDPRWKVLADASVKMAEHLVRRDLDFPTEGTGGRHEMEDGSISCTALSLLYVHLFIEERPEFLAAAEKVLKFHDAWNIVNPDARMYYSSLRWWEAHWEGDADGSGINAGHAWTLWKAEANYLYAYCKGDFDRAVKSYCGYITNLCKVREDGGMYTCFTPDYITSKPSLNRVGHQFPDNVDHSMPYYLWGRADKTWFESSGLGCVDGKTVVLNGYVKEDGGKAEFVSSAIDFRTFFVTDGVEEIILNTENNIRIITENPDKVKVLCGYAEYSDDHSVSVLPIAGKIIISTM